MSTPLLPRILRARKRAIPSRMLFNPPRFYADSLVVPFALSFFRFMTQLALAIKNAGLVEIDLSSWTLYAVPLPGLRFRLKRCRHTGRYAVFLAAEWWPR